MTKSTGPGLTGHMSPSLVPWGGFVLPASFHELPTVFLFFYFFSINVSVFPCFPPVFHHFPFNCRLVSTCFHCFGRMSPRQQRLRDSVAPGPGTIVFVNPQDHPGIGTPGGTKSTGYLRLSQVNISFVYSFVYRCIIDVSNIIKSCFRQQICSKASASPAASSRCQSGARSALG